jgi:general secretion pathway protein L
MALLQLFLPEGWPTDASENAPVFRWSLHDGINLRAGSGPLTELPRADEVLVIIPASRAVFLRAMLPPGNPSKLSDVLAYAVEDRLLGDPETIHCTAGSRDEQGSAAIAVVDRAWLTQALQLLAAVGVRPKRMVSEVFLAPVAERAWSVVWTGNGGFVRASHEMGFALDAAGHGDAPIALVLALQEAASEKIHLPERLVVHAAPAHAPDLARWQQALSIPVQAGTAWEWQRAEPTDGAINLLQGRFSPSRSGAELLTRYRAPAILASALLGVYMVISVGDFLWLSWQKQRLQSQMTREFKTLYPDANVSDAALQMSRKLADARRARGQADATDFLPLTAYTASGVASLGARVQGLQYDRGKLQLDLLFPTLESAESLKPRLNLPGVNTKVDAVSPAANGSQAKITITSAG